MGLMLESSSERLCEPGGPHWGCPDKQPAVRLGDDPRGRRARRAVHDRSPGRHRRNASRDRRVTARAAGAARSSRPHAGADPAELPRQAGHADGRRHRTPRSSCSSGRSRSRGSCSGPSMSIQAPPNLRRGELEALLAAGVNDWGGVSPVTPDHVNPEAAWPDLAVLARETRDGRSRAGRAARTRAGLCAQGGSLGRRDPAAARRAAA